MRRRALGVGRGVVVASVIFAFGHPVAAADVFRIGMLTDMSSAYSDLAGKYSVAAAQMAIDDFGGHVLGKRIELVTADHQMKPSVGSAIATGWFDRDNVQAIFGLAGSSVAMAAQEIGRTRPNRTIVYTIAQTSDLSGKACAANAIQWAPDFHALGVSASRYATERHGKSSYLLLPDTAAGAPALRAAERGIALGGGEVKGAVKVPVASGDVSSFVLQAQASGARNLIIGFGGSDMVNVVKAASQFGLQRSGVSLVSLGLFATDVDAMGLDLAAGITFSTPFYPAMSEASLAWSTRFRNKTGRLPAFSHVAEYEAVTHYLNAVREVGTADAGKVVPAMRSHPVKSFALDGGIIRADNHLTRPMFIGRIKSSGEAKSPEDYVAVLATIPAEEAYSPLSLSECPLVKK